MIGRQKDYNKQLMKERPYIMNQRWIDEHDELIEYIKENLI